jgi:hypothetical protein
MHRRPLAAFPLRQSATGFPSSFAAGEARLPEVVASSLQHPGVRPVVLERERPFGLRLRLLLGRGARAELENDVLDATLAVVVEPVLQRPKRVVATVWAGWMQEAVLPVPVPVTARVQGDRSPPNGTQVTAGRVRGNALNQACFQWGSRHYKSDAVGQRGNGETRHE